MTDLDFDEQQWRALRACGLTLAQIDSLRASLWNIALLRDPHGMTKPEQDAVADRYRGGRKAIDTLIHLLVEQAVETDDSAIARTGLQRAISELDGPNRDMAMIRYTLPMLAIALRWAEEHLKLHRYSLDGRASVVEAVLNALARPQDAASQDSAARLRPIKGTRGTPREGVRSRRSHFPEVLRVTVNAATGQVINDVGRWIDAWNLRPATCNLPYPDRVHKFLPKAERKSDT